MIKEYILIDGEKPLQKALDHLENYSVIAYDVESTGLNVRKDRVIGIAFTGKEAMGFYYPIMYWQDHIKALTTHPFYSDNTLNKLLSVLKTKKLVMHNASYDIRITANDLKTNLLSALHADTMLMEHTINEDGPFGLKDI